MESGLERPGQGNFWGGWFEFVEVLFLLEKDLVVKNILLDCHSYRVLVTLTFNAASVN